MGVFWAGIAVRWSGIVRDNRRSVSSFGYGAAPAADLTGSPGELDQRRLRDGATTTSQAKSPRGSGGGGGERRKAERHTAHERTPKNPVDQANCSAED
jgi:hypothetical protein